MEDKDSSPKVTKDLKCKIFFLKLRITDTILSRYNNEIKQILENVHFLLIVTGSCINIRIYNYSMSSEKR